MTNPELSVVVLGYRAGRALRGFVNELTDFLEKDNIDYQIVLVGNYWSESKDITPEIVKEIAGLNKRVKPIIMRKKGAMGWDMQRGLENADGKLIAIIDGDGQMPSFDVVRVYRMIKEGGFDFVKTYREERLDDYWRRNISFFYNMIFKALFPGLHLRDINSKPKIFTREIYKKLCLSYDDWFIDAEMMIQIRRHNAKMNEIPTVFNQNKERPSFVKFSTIFEFIKNLIKARIYESFNNWRSR